MQTALKLKAASFYLDGECVVCNERGLAIFDKLHSKGHDDAAHLFAFDLLEIDGADIRHEPLIQRKRRLLKLVGRRQSGIIFNDHIAGDGATIFRHACEIGCEGIVSKRLDLGYTSGRVRGWIKVKNSKGRRRR